MPMCYLEQKCRRFSFNIYRHEMWNNIPQEFSSVNATDMCFLYFCLWQVYTLMTVLFVCWINYLRSTNQYACERERSTRGHKRPLEIIFGLNDSDRNRIRDLWLASKQSYWLVKIIFGHFLVRRCRTIRKRLIGWYVLLNVSWSWTWTHEVPLNIWFSCISQYFAFTIFCISSTKT